MSRTSLKQNGLHQQLTTERIVRLEVERRHAKGTLRVIDNMIREVDDQLLYVAQFKKEWLQHRKELEAARQVVMVEENTRRIETEEEHKNGMKQISRKLVAIRVKSPSTSRGTSLDIAYM